MNGCDSALFARINGLAGHHAALDALMIVAAKYAPLLYALLLVGCWLTWRARWQRGAALAGISALVALGVGQVIGFILPRARPYEVLAAHVLVVHAPDTSFPSDHAILVGAVTVALWGLHRGLNSALVVTALLVLTARVYIGVHYPTDVIGGALLGAVMASALLRFARGGAGARWLERAFALLRRLRLAAVNSSADGKG